MFFRSAHVGKVVSQAVIQDKDKVDASKSVGQPIQETQLSGQASTPSTSAEQSASGEQGGKTTLPV